MRKKARKTTKICLVCGEEFLGTASAQTCSGSCRVALSRIKAANKRPEFILMAKSKGQKIPDLNAPKRLKFKKGEKKSQTEWLSKNITITPVSEKSFDGETLSALIQDEMGQMEAIIASPLTKDQKGLLILDLEKQIEAIKAKNHKPGDGHPKIFAMQKESDIAAIQEKINKLK